MKAPLRSRLALLALALAGVTAVAGCASGPEPSGPPAEVAPDEPSGNITVRVFSGLRTQDPFADSNQGSWQYFRQIYEGLVTVDDALKPQPLLAESWEINEDATEFTFHLRDDVLFHDGSTMDAADVVYSLNYFQENAEYDINLGDVASIEAEDDYTVVVSLNSPKASLVNDLGATIGPSIVPEGSADGGALASAGIGTGPFYIDEFEPEVRSVLKPFTDHYVIDAEPSGLAGARVPLLESVEFVVVADDGVAVTGFQSGEYDIDTHLSTVNLDQLKTDPELVVFEQPGSGWVRISLNLAGSELMGNPLIRQAIIHATDPEAFVQSTTLDHARVVDGYNPPEVYWYIDGVSNYWPYEYDPQKAKDLLEEAGYDGTPIEIIAGGPSYQGQNAVVFQQLAEAVGLNVVVNQLEHATFLQRGVKGEYELNSSGGALNTTPDILYYSWYCNANKRFGYCNPEYDAIYDEAVATVDLDDRVELFGELEKILKDDAVILPLYLNDLAYGASVSVHNFQPNFLDAFMLWNVWADDSK